MRKRPPFYLSDSFIETAKKRPNIIKREIDRIMRNNPEGERLPYEAARFVLGVVAAGVVMTSFVAMPGAVIGAAWLVKMLKSTNDPYARRLAKYRHLQRTIERLHRQQYIAFVRKHNNASAVLTDKGKARILSYALEDLAIPTPSSWDQKWRVIAFDIPHKRKIARDTLRAKLRNLGFSQVQKSVFVHPYPCEEEIMVITESFGIWHNVIFLIVSHLGSKEADARKFFDLL